MSNELKLSKKRSYLPGQLVMAHNVWNIKNKIYLTYGADPAILCMFISSHCEANGYCDYDILLYEDRLVHARPNSIKAYGEV